MAYLPGTVKSFWGNELLGKDVEVTSALVPMGGPAIFYGNFVRIDKFEYRYYLVLAQKSGKTININIDHIFSIEEDISK